MKNTKRLILFGVLFLMVLVLSIELLLWMNTDFDPYYSAIDTCLDQGGQWDDMAKVCQKP